MEPMLAWHTSLCVTDDILTILAVRDTQMLDVHEHCKLFGKQKY